MSHRGQAAYVSNCTRPDVACAVNQLSQVKEIEAADPNFKRLDGIFSMLKADDFRLCYGNVDIDTAEIHVFADASFATNKDLSSPTRLRDLTRRRTGHLLFLKLVKFKV